MKRTRRSYAAGVATLLMMMLLLLLMTAASAQQAIESSKKTMTQNATRSQLVCRKMDHVANGASQDAAQDCYAFTKNVQTHAMAKKMTQSGKGTAVNQGHPAPTSEAAATDRVASHPPVRKRRKEIP